MGSSIARTSFLALPLLMTQLMLVKPSLASSYLYNSCANNTMFLNNSEYHTNLDTLLDSLSSNPTANNIGFYNTSAAKGTSDAVYGLYLCRGDQNATSCSECVKTATADLPERYCPNNKVAIIWYDECMVRYSNVSFFGKMESSLRIDAYNVNEGSGNRFVNNVNETLNNLGGDAAIDASGKKFATRTIKFSNSNETFYGLAQCTPDLSASDCERCMKIAIGSLRVQEGSRVLLPSCNGAVDPSPPQVAIPLSSSHPPAAASRPDATTNSSASV